LSEDAHSSPPTGEKEKVIAFAKVALELAAAGLKAAPVPNLDQIPNILLSLIQTYEVSRLAPISPATPDQPIQMFRLQTEITKSFKSFANQSTK
jgi:hypothetical protein